MLDILLSFECAFEGGAPLPLYAEADRGGLEGNARGVFARPLSAGG